MIRKDRMELAKTLLQLQNAQGSPYISSKWVFKNVLRIVPSDYYCPNCLNNGKFSIEDESWNRLCECGWKGAFEDCIGIEEVKNRRRIRTIKEMLK